MTTCLPFFRRVKCWLLLAATLSLTPCFAETNSPAVNPEDGRARLSERAESENPESGARGATRPTENPGAVEIAPAVSNTVHSAIATPQSAITNHSAIANPQSPITPAFPTTNVTGSFMRVMAMLAVVLGLFIGGMWLFRNWQRLTINRGSAPKLNILETRSLGGRHAIFVVGYENERFLVASSPAGINMLTHLQSADESAPAENKPATPQPTFASTLAQMLKGKTS